MQRLNAIALVVAAVLFVGLGATWAVVQSRRPPAPVWRATDFALVREASEARDGDRWVVAVNTGCPHCREHLARLATERHAAGGGPTLAALLVDVPARPDTTSLDALASGGVWWDSAGVWRESWGHRAYGEVLVFDSSGRHRRTLPPGAPYSR